ncbi:MAG: SMC-Scp complex subunit ScpB [Clostridia bacterium]|nr:SMC-Scp complex subunit ScpB [Clostridia bacterium]
MEQTTNEQVLSENIENNDNIENKKETTKEMTIEETYRIIEGMLFVSNDPVPVKGIATALEKSINDTNVIMDELIKKYEEDETRGIKIVRFDNKFQLVTKQNIFGYLTKANAELEKPRISPAMLETLAIIAYKQPITKLEIESIRGVKTDYIVNKLVEYELVCEVGRADKIGRPILFGTTDKFLIYFGLTNLQDLPTVEESRPITNDTIDEELIKLKQHAEKEPSEEITLAISAAEELAKELKENPPKTDEETKEDGEEVTEETNEETNDNSEVKEDQEESTEESNDNEEDEDEEEKEFDVDNIDWDSYTEEDDEDDDDWDDDDDDWDDEDFVEDEEDETNN